MASSILDLGIGYGCDLDLIEAIRQYSDDCYHNQSSEIYKEAYGFCNTSISEWDGEHCVAWVLSVCQKYGLDSFSVDLGHLGSSSGMLLLQSSKQDFCQMMGDVLGKILYQEIKLLKGSQSEKDYSVDMNLNADSYNLYKNDMQEYSISNMDSYELFHTYNSQGYTALDNYGNLDSHNLEVIQHSYRHNESPDSQIYEDSQNYGHYTCDESGVGNVDDLEYINPKDLIRMDSYEAKMAFQDKDLELHDAHNSTYHPGENVNISQESEGLMGSNQLELAKDTCGKVATTSKRQEREPKNWEFLIRLLADPRANPKLIRWDDETKGTFFLEKPDIITYLWNSRSNKPPISYHNFARGLRYHYKTGALFKIEERQLVYGCGPKAIEFYKKIKSKATNMY